MGTRTPDPLHAKQVLYQLSYIPKRRPGGLYASPSAPVKRMKKALVSSIALAIGFVHISAPANTSAAAVAAVNRCNSQVVDESYARIRDYDRKAPGTGTADLLRRFAAIADVLTTLHEEREIVDSVCSTDAARAPLFTELAASSAWALTLEADIASALNASCSAAQKALPTMMLADAWLAMANVINDNNGVVPPLFTDTIVRSGIVPRPSGLRRRRGARPLATGATTWRPRLKRKSCDPPFA